MFVINEPELASKAKSIVPKLWGTEFVLLNNERYCCKFLRINPGFVSSIHAHERKDETFVGVSGTVKLTIYTEDKQSFEEHIIASGVRIRIPPQIYHSFEAVTQAWVMEVSTPHSDSDVRRLEESRRIDAKKSKG